MKYKTLIIIISVALLLFGCQKSKLITHEETDENTGSQVDIHDFSFIKMAPESKKKQNLNDVIKILLIENADMLDSGFAIDIENEQVYIDPLVGSRGVRTTIEEPSQLHDAEDLIEILEEYKVQDWKAHYTHWHSREDEYGWYLLLQFADGSVEKHGGSGVKMNKVHPKNFNPFYKELKEAIEERVDS